MTIAIRGALQTGTSTAGANITVDLSLISGLAQGDIVLVFTALTTASMGASDPIVTSANWNDCGIGRKLNSDSLRAIRCYWKIMGASPDTSVAINGTGTAGDSTGAIAIAFSGVNPDNPLDATALSSSGASPADLVSISPGHNGALVIGAAVGAYDTSKSTISNYTLGARDTNATRGQSIGLAYRVRAAATGGAENPPAWATNWAAGNWASIVLALNSTIKFPAATGLTTGSPTFGIPIFNNIVLFPTAYTSASPVIDATPAFAKAAEMPVCVAGPFVTGSPTFGTPQVISPVAIGKTVGSPTFGTPQVISPVAVGKTVGSPTFGAPQVISPVAIGKTVGSPIFANPTVAVVVPCVATALTVGSPTFGTPNALSPKANALTVGSPTFGTPRVVSPVALGLTVGSPILGVPALTGVAGVVDFIATNFAAGSPTFGIDWGTNTGNYITNNTMQGAVAGVVGSGGVVPTGWVFNNANTVIYDPSATLYTIVSTGVDGSDVYYVESALTTTEGDFFPNISPANGVFVTGAQTIYKALNVPAGVTQTTFSFWYQVTNDDANLFDILASIYAYDAGGNVISSSSTSLFSTRTTFNRHSINYDHAGTPVAYWSLSIVPEYNTSLTNFRQKIGSPQFEVGNTANAIINTYGVSKLNQKHVFNASTLTVGSPVFGTPIAAVVGPNEILASSFTETSPSFTQPTLSSIFAIVAAPITIGSPTLGAPNVISPKAIGLTVGSPVLGTPVAGVQGNEKTLATNGLVVGSPTLGTPQVISPVAMGLTVGSPVFGVPNVLSLKAVGITVGSPVFGVPNVLSPKAVGITVGSPVFGVPNVLSPKAVGITVGSPVFGVPNVLSPKAVGITVGSPSLGTPNVVSPRAVGLTVGSPTFGQGIAGIEGIIAAVSLTVGSPVLGVPNVISPKAIGLTVGSPTIGSGVAGIQGIITAVPLTVGQPVLGVPNVISPIATNLTEASPFFTQPTLSVVANAIDITATSLAIGSPVLGTPNVISLRAVGLTVGSPTFTSTNMTGAVIVTAANLTVGSPALSTPKVISPNAIGLTVGSPVLGAPKVISPVAIGLTVGSPTFSSTNMTGSAIVTAANLTVGSPVLGVPNVLSLKAVGLTVNSPTLGASALRKVITATNLTVGAPVLGTAVLRKVLGATNLTVGSPVFGVPHIVSPVAHSLVIGSPVFGHPYVGLAGQIIPVALTLSGPVMGTGALRQAQKLTAVGLTTHSPTLGHPRPAVGTNAVGLTVGNPTIGASALGQRLDATGLTIGRPSLGAGAFVRVAMARTLGVTINSPTISQPTIRQAHKLATAGVTVSGALVAPASMGVAGHPTAVPLVVGRPDIAANLIVQNYKWQAYSAIVARPTISRAIMGVVCHPEAVGLTVGQPTLGKPSLAIRIDAVGIEVGAPVIEAPTAHAISHFTARPLTVARPKIGQGYYQPWGGYHICRYDAYYITTEYEVYFSPQDWEAFRLTDEDEVYPEGIAA